MFIFRALDKHGSFHAAKVLTFSEKCNTLGGFFMLGEKEKKRRPKWWGTSLDRVARAGWLSERPWWSWCCRRCSG